MWDRMLQTLWIEAGWGLNPSPTPSRNHREQTEDGMEQHHERIVLSFCETYCLVESAWPVPTYRALSSSVDMDAPPAFNAIFILVRVVWYFWYYVVRVTVPVVVLICCRDYGDSYGDYPQLSSCWRFGWHESTRYESSSFIFHPIIYVIYVHI